MFAVLLKGAIRMNAKKLGAYCADHPDAGLITATDAVFKKK